VPWTVKAILRLAQDGFCSFRTREAVSWQMWIIPTEAGLAYDQRLRSHRGARSLQDFVSGLVYKAADVVRHDFRGSLAVSLLQSVQHFCQIVEFVDKLLFIEN
jgi:hypothetical protein